MDIDRSLIRKRIEECRQGLWPVKSWKVDGTNKFLQLCPDGLRINFFLADAEENVESPPHTHDIGFTSTIVYGKLVNTILDVEDAEDGDYERYALGKPDPLTYTFNETRQRCRVVGAKSKTYYPGDTYVMDPRQYHRTRFTETTVTYLRRWPEELVQTFHLVRPGKGVPKQPDRTTSATELPGVWRTIDAVCERIGL